MTIIQRCGDGLRLSQDRPPGAWPIGEPQAGWSSGRARIAQRLSPLIAACGVVAVPALLVRHQARLQLSNAEVIYLLHVLSHRWDGDYWPWRPRTQNGRAPSRGSGVDYGAA
jgi:hypothetical protein